MGIVESRTKMRETLASINEIRAKASPTQEDLTKLREFLTTAHAVKADMELLGQAGDFDQEMAKSAGMLQLASTNQQPNGAQVVGVKQSGVVQIAQKNGQLVIDEESEQTPMDRKTWELISSAEYRRAFKTYLRVGQEGLRYDALKVLQEGVDTQGGYLVPDDILSRLIAKEPAPTSLASRVTTLTTGRDRLTVPRVVYTTDNQYTSGMRVTWTGEIPASATTHRVTEPSFGQASISIYTAMMSLPLTNDMVEDANYPLVNWCTGKFSETNDLLKDNMIINGTGVGQPAGMLINAQFITNDVHTTAAAALTWDGINDLLYALPEQYDSNAAVFMNKTNTALALAKLQDGNGRPYWTTGSQDYGLAGQRINRPLLGYDVVFNAFMPNVGAGNYPIIFGDARGYWLVNRVGFSIQVLRELYAETNQILLLGRVRFGGQLIEDYKVRGQVVSA